MPATKNEVVQFLNDFKTKMSVFRIIFLERGKNSQALLDLEITPISREEYIRSLEVQHYCDGPIDDRKFEGMDLWEFGRTINKKEIYIKICMGYENNPVICISFHLAKHKLRYPYH